MSLHNSQVDPQMASCLSDLHVFMVSCLETSGGKEGSSNLILLRPAVDRESGLKYFGQSKIEAVVTSVENVTSYKMPKDNTVTRCFATKCTTHSKQSIADDEVVAIVSLAKELGINGPQKEKIRLPLLPLISTCPFIVEQETQGDVLGPGNFQPASLPNPVSWALSIRPSPLAQETSQCKMEGPVTQYHSSYYWYDESLNSDFQDSPCHWRCYVEEPISDVDQTTARASESVYSDTNSECGTPRSMRQSSSHSQRSDSTCVTPKITPKIMPYTEGCGIQCTEEQQQGFAEHPQQEEQHQCVNLQNQNHGFRAPNVELENQIDGKSKLQDENARLMARIAELEARVAACNSKLASSGTCSEEKNVSQDDVNGKDVSHCHRRASMHVVPVSSLKRDTFLEQLQAWHDKFTASISSSPGIYNIV